jgi:hypothetical protein
MPREMFELIRLLKDGFDQEVSAQDFEICELRHLIKASVQGKAMFYIRDSAQLRRIDVVSMILEEKTEALRLFGSSHTKNVFFR